MTMTLSKYCPPVKVVSNCLPRSFPDFEGKRTNSAGSSQSAERPRKHRTMKNRAIGLRNHYFGDRADHAYPRPQWISAREKKTQRSFSGAHSQYAASKGAPPDVSCRVSSREASSLRSTSARSTTRNSPSVCAVAIDCYNHSCSLLRSPGAIAGLFRSQFLTIDHRRSRISVNSPCIL